jgi:hypothetical protein
MNGTREASSLTDLSTARTLLRRVGDLTHVEVATLVSLPVILFNVRHDDPSLVVALAFAASAIASRRVRLAPWSWLALAAVLGYRQSLDFVRLDDHVVLTVYWCAAVGLSLSTTDPARAIRRSAALLVGVVFLLAAIWKLTSGQFIDGRFFRFALIWDPRFHPMAEVTGQPTVGAYRDTYDTFVPAADIGGTLLWREGPRSAEVAGALTAWAVAIEAAVAITFLLPLARLDRMRNVAMAAFLTTYILVPVIGFATLLCVLAATVTENRRWRRAYLVVIGLCFLWPPIRYRW